MPENLKTRIKEAWKTLTGVQHPRTLTHHAYGWETGQFSGSNIDYRALVGDLSQSSLVMSGVRWLGNVLPSAPLMVKEDIPGKDGAKGETREVPNHDLVRLWRRPNKFYSGSTLQKGLAFSWILSGNAYIIKERNKYKTLVTGLWWEPHFSIRPRWLNDDKANYIRGESDNPSDFINYYEVDRDGRQYRVEVADVIHLRDGFDPKNWRLGLSRVGAILREIYGDSEAANYAARMAGGSGVPSGVLSLDKDLQVDAEDLENIKNRLVRQTTGDNRFAPLVVTGATWEQMGVDPDKMDLRSGHRFAEERFSAVTGIPAVALELGAGHEHSIYNNVKAADERAWEAYLLPLYSHFEDELDVQLLEDFEGESSKRYCRFDLSNVRALQEDTDAIWTRLGEAYEKGGIKRSEYRSGIGFEPAEDGSDDVYVSETSESEEELPQTPEQARLRLVKAVKSLVKPNGHEHEFKGFNCTVCQKSASEILKEAEVKAEKVPSEKEVDEAVEWYERNAPEEARGLINAKGKA